MPPNTIPMSDEQKNMLERDLSELFGLGEMRDEEKVSFLDDIGSMIMESATLRFMVEADEQVVSQFEQQLEALAEKEDAFEILLKTFPRYAEILEEEIVAFKTEAAAVLV